MLANGRTTMEKAGGEDACVELLALLSAGLSPSQTTAYNRTRRAIFLRLGSPESANSNPTLSRT